MLSTALEREAGGRASETYRFKVRSSLLQDVQSQDKAVTHCQGRVLRHPDLLNQDGEGAIYLPAADRLLLKDIGREGTEWIAIGGRKVEAGGHTNANEIQSPVVQGWRNCGRSILSRWWGRRRRPMASSMQTPR